MKNSLSTIVFILLVFTVSSIAQSRIIHNPQPFAQAGKDLVISIKFDPPDTKVWMLELYYRSISANSYQKLDMQKWNDTWQVVIPAKSVKGEGIEYFISALLGTQSVITWPAFNPYHKPFRLNLTAATEQTPIQTKILASPPADTTAAIATNALQKADEISPQKNLQQKQDSTVTISALPDEKKQVLNSPPPFIDSRDVQINMLSPEEEENVNQSDILLAISYQLKEKGLDSSRIHIFLDGINVTSKFSISSYMILVIICPAVTDWTTSVPSALTFTSSINFFTTI